MRSLEEILRWTNSDWGDVAVAEAFCRMLADDLAREMASWQGQGQGPRTEGERREAEDVIQSEARKLRAKLPDRAYAAFHRIALDGIVGLGER